MFNYLKITTPSQFLRCGYNSDSKYHFYQWASERYDSLAWLKLLLDEVLMSPYNEKHQGIVLWIVTINHLLPLSSEAPSRKSGTMRDTCYTWMIEAMYSMNFNTHRYMHVHAWNLTEATKAIASMPPGHCLGAFERSSTNFTMSSLGALYWGENCHCPLKDEAYRPECIQLIHIQ